MITLRIRNVIEFKKLAKRAGMPPKLFKQMYMADLGTVITLADGARFKFIDTTPDDLRDGLWEAVPRA